MKHLILFVCLLFVSVNSFAASTPRMEYPRPQFERAAWVNLNGQWTYTFDMLNEGIEKEYNKATSFDGNITVPFCPESSLSGVKYTGFISNIWYHRTIQCPADWKDKCVMLNFGAVYYNSEVYIDGKLVGRHFGGSSSFSFDVSEYVSDGESHNLVVKASSDVRSMKQSAGKQSLVVGSHGCDYTRTTGIWQTVWMEAVDKHGLKSAKVTADIDQSQIVVQPTFWNVSPLHNIKVTLKDGDKVIATKTVAASNSSHIVIPVKNQKLWSPESPFLYDLVYEVTDGSGKVVDQVKSYAGMRKVHIEGNKIYLNNAPIYMRLVLDQGFYPDGIWTAPSDAALRGDIEMSMKAGFNGARLHQKVFEERFYYWADKLGYLTWGEAPSWGMDANDVEASRNFITEWSELVARDVNHPSLVVWTPLNEEWWPDAVQYSRFVSDLYDLTKRLDPTRPVNDASGGVHIKTDIWTVHNYEQDPAKLKDILYKDGKFFQTPNWANKNPNVNVGFNSIFVDTPNVFKEYTGGMPYFLDEVGGIKLVKESDKTNTEQSWGYGTPPRNEEEFFERLEGQIDAVLSLSDVLWGYCYTQLTDVEQEQNGVLYYNRQPKVDMQRLYKIFSKQPKK